jgi:hypothetical protein
MPPRKKKPSGPLPKDFSAIGIGERLRWLGGRVVVSGSYTPALGTEGGSSVVVWPSWAAWAETYRVCREAFLEHCGSRHPHRTPGSELLFAAFKSGGDSAAAKAQAQLRDQEDANDPRRLVFGSGRR